ncbi:NAD-dependent epimerase/dehydratase family protein [Candidatus Margulisiibacteriota bacterium]
MAKYLVTGAAGFIGSVLANYLIQKGNDVITIDNLTTGSKENLPKGIEFIQGNCQDPEIIKELNGIKLDAIFHLAGQSSGEISFDDPVYDLQTNTQSTLLLLNFAKESGCKKFIYASSMSVYGEQAEQPVNESATTNPKSFYAIGKLASEQYLKIFQDTYGLKTTALRLFNVYGPGQNMENLRQGMLSIYLSLALKNKNVTVKGSAERYRDFIYIDDAVTAFTKALEQNSPKFEAYNVACGVKTTVAELIENMKTQLPFKFSVEYQENTKGDMFGIYGDNSKIKKELNWEPTIFINKNGMSKMVEWVLKK